MLESVSVTKGFQLAFEMLPRIGGAGEDAGEDAGAQPLEPAPKRPGIAPLTPHRCVADVGLLVLSAIGPVQRAPRGVS